MRESTEKQKMLEFIDPLLEMSTVTSVTELYHHLIVLINNEKYT